MNTTSNAFCPYLGGPGLQVTIAPGTVLCANIATKLPLTVVPLTANATNFVYLQILEVGEIANPFTPQANPSQLTPTITVTTNPSVGPDSGIPLAVVVTGATGVLSLTDVRPDFVI